MTIRHNKALKNTISISVNNSQCYIATEDFQNIATSSFNIKIQKMMSKLKMFLISFLQADTTV